MLFKNKYIIAIYNKSDEVIYICESANDLSKFLNQSLNSIRVILNRAVKSIDKHTNIEIDTIKHDLYLIEEDK